MSERYVIGKREALKLLPVGDPIPMKSPDGTKHRNFTRKRAMTTVSNAISRIYMQNTIDGDIVIITTTKGTEWVYEAPLNGYQERSISGSVGTAGSSVA